MQKSDEVVGEREIGKGEREERERDRERGIR